MSQSFEKETSGSTFKSLVGALIALGSGFVFMFLGLVAVNASSHEQEGDRTARVLVQALSADLLAHEVGSVQVSKDHKTLKFRLQSQQVTYRVLPDSGRVDRVFGGTTRMVANLKDVRFESASGLLRLFWLAPDGKARNIWALKRWAPEPGKST
jgi:hypothetical protein